jgi:molybdopterin adenylyltransferase
MGIAATVITVSDGVSTGTREDAGGTAVAAALEEHDFEVIARVVVADEAALIEAEIRSAAASSALVVTTGGTGLGPRDRTPEATLAAADFTVPGLAEEMRRAGRFSTPMALLSRALVVAVGPCLVINLPGKPAGAVESLEAIVDLVPHALEILAGGGHPTG